MMDDYGGDGERWSLGVGVTMEVSWKRQHKILPKNPRANLPYAFIRHSSDGDEAVEFMRRVTWSILKKAAKNVIKSRGTTRAVPLLLIYVRRYIIFKTDHVLKNIFHFLAQKYTYLPYFSGVRRRFWSCHGGCTNANTWRPLVETNMSQAVTNAHWACDSTIFRTSIITFCIYDNQQLPMWNGAIPV